MKLSEKDRNRLRALAGHQAEIASSEKMRQLYADWERHGRFEKNARPMLTIELETFADEFLPSLLQCEDPDARRLETALLSNVIPYEMFGDDTVVRNYLPVELDTEFVPFNLKPRKECSGRADYIGAGFRYNTYLHDLEEDFHLLGKSTYSFDVEKTQRKVDICNDIFGDLLPARRTGGCLCVSAAEDIIHIMEMSDLYIAMLEEPELVNKMFDMLMTDYGEYFDEMEKQNLLLPTTGDVHLLQGSFCFNPNLPSDNITSTSQVWGYMDAEEMNDVSAAMYKEFIVDHYSQLAKRFGALSFGCCEAISRFWENSVETMPNLRKVSISAWCDVHYMGEQLKGKNIVFLRKPTANLLGVTAELDEDATTKYFRETAEAASGCRLEVTQRDVYCLHDNLDKVSHYVALARAALEKYWKP